MVNFTSSRLSEVESKDLLFSLIILLALNENLFTLFKFYSNFIHLLLLILSVAIFLLAIRERDVLKKVLEKNVHRVVGFYLVILLIHQFLYKGFVTHLFDWIRLTGIYLLVVIYCYDKRFEDLFENVKKVCLFIIGITCLYSFISILILLFNPQYPIENGVIGIADGRLWGFRKNPNTDAIYASISIFCSFILIKYKYPLSRTYLFLNFFLQVFILLFSGSRSALLVTILFSIGFIFELKKNKFLFFSILALVTFGVLSPYVRNFVFSGAKVEGCHSCNIDKRKISSDSSRLKIWTSCIKAIPSNVLGVGKRNIKEACSPYSTNRVMRENYPHNFIIQEFVANGVFLGLTLILFFAWLSYYLLAISYIKGFSVLSFFGLGAMLRGSLDIDFWPSPSLFNFLFILMMVFLQRSIDFMEENSKTRQCIKDREMPEMAFESVE